MTMFTKFFMVSPKTRHGDQRFSTRWARRWVQTLLILTALVIGSGNLFALADRPKTKLAASRQVYLLIDLINNVIVIKGRGLELYRLPIHSWTGADPGSLNGSFRLRGRPPVIRPKVVAPADSSAPPALPEPISLRDMPAEYDLVFDPNLTIAVAPPLHEQPWLRAQSHFREWWQQAFGWVHLGPTSKPSPAGPRLRLTMTRDAAKSLAWTVTDGMPLLIVKPAATPKAPVPFSFQPPATADRP
jgi:hypothetical protein